MAETDNHELSDTVLTLLARRVLKHLQNFENELDMSEAEIREALALGAGFIPFFEGSFGHLVIVHRWGYLYVFTGTVREVISGAKHVENVYEDTFFLDKSRWMHGGNSVGILVDAPKTTPIYNVKVLDLKEIAIHDFIDGMMEMEQALAPAE
jgi:hypothetical protein